MNKFTSLTFLLFVLLSFKDLYMSFGQTKNDQNSDYNYIQKKIPESHLNRIPTALTVKISYCFSCGYKKAFEDYKQLLNDRYPDVIVTGDHYQPPGLRFYLATFLSFAKYILIISIILDRSSPILNMISPSIRDWVINHKLYACLMCFFLCNTFENSLLSTGAFEIEFNDILIWSKIKNGRIPAPTEIFSVIDNFSRDRNVNVGGSNSFIN